VWKKILQVVEGFNVEVCESVWKRILQVVEGFNVEV